MKLQILGCGTSTGVPIPGCECEVCLSDNPMNSRTRTSAIVKLDNGFNILIDASTDLRQQALRWNIKRVDAVIYTHAHADHILGTDDLRCFNFALRKNIPCYGTAPTLDGLKKSFSYIFDPDPNYKGGMLAQLDLHEIVNGKTFITCDTEITPFALIHGNMEVSGFRIGDFAYATDCKVVPEASLEIMKGAKYLILDALRDRAHNTHLTISEAVEIAKAINAEHTYLVHMTHEVDFDQVSRELPENISLSYDGLEIEL